jgi:hypothetical protein
MWKCVTCPIASSTVRELAAVSHYRAASLCPASTPAVLDDAHDDAHFRHTTTTVGGKLLGGKSCVYQFVAGDSDHSLSQEVQGRREEGRGVQQIQQLVGELQRFLAGVNPGIHTDEHGQCPPPYAHRQPLLRGLLDL